jgi:hypothetical protein
MEQQKDKFATAIEACKIHWTEVNHPASTKKHSNERMGVEEGAIQLVEELSVNRSNVTKTDMQISRVFGSSMGISSIPSVSTWWVGRLQREGKLRSSNG